MGRVVSIHIVRQKDAPAVELDVAQVIADYGLDGDWRARWGRSRQMTLIELETLERVATTLGLPVVPPGSSRRQIVVRDVNLNDAIGKRLRIGPALVVVEKPCDPCTRMEIAMGRGARNALEGRGGVCARIVEGGAIRPGDAVTIVDIE
jgi:MOSC domain-containing protein YiiM